MCKYMTDKIVLNFEHPITNEKKMHKGIDIPATTGIDIVATDDGIVKFSGVQNGYGNVIEIEHFGGKTSNEREGVPLFIISDISSSKFVHTPYSPSYFASSLILSVSKV